MQFADSDELCQYIAQQTEGKALLSFSCGKDSIGAWLQMRRHFTEIIPFYMYLIPGLQFIEDQVQYYEQQFGCHIYRMPHPSLYRMWNHMVYQAPANIRKILEARLWDFEYDDVLDIVRAKHKLTRATYAATGVRAVDSPQRWASMKKYGPMNEKRGVFYPIFDWRKDRLLDEIRASGIKLSRDYPLFSRSFDGLDYRFLKGIAEHYPADYARIQECFPLIDLVLHKYQYRADYYARKGARHAH
jgi:3'-phosphoadenosine 5'-phosphosulfate sulfotransferase (PAPS reductase)/FAD synthetase